MSNRPSVLQLQPTDNVAIALEDLPPGAELGMAEAIAAEAIPRGHKVALRAIARGERVRKYGQVIGEATAAIEAGRHVHVHNLAFCPSEADHSIGNSPPGELSLPASPHTTFMGLRRSDGRVATRNYIGVVTSVNCANTVARLIADQFRFPGALAEFPNVDGIVALTHAQGCAAGSDSEATDLLRRTIGGYLGHPNFAAVLVVGLGCESNQIDRLLDQQGLAADARIRPFVIQEMGGTARTVQGGVGQIRELLPDANRVAREPVPLSHLKLGLQCGGSDGFSGFTANPAL
ncbi:MAG: UxaA family hydrolase, partial [Rhizobiales bacterium]|nr:UxaA family hydrolase [Hyphomicrobiales bacterium]